MTEVEPVVEMLCVFFNKKVMVKSQIPTSHQLDCL